MAWWNPFGGADEQEIAALVATFPAVLRKAVEDWGKYKAGVKAGLFSQSQQGEILDWFASFPRLWETIKPNFDPWKADGTLDQGKFPLYSQAELFVTKLRGTAEIKSRIGIAPLIIAGILIAGVFGVAGAVWAVGYVKNQDNVSKMIDGVTAGTLPASVLNEAVKAETGSIFGDIGGVLKWAVVAGALVLGWPLISKLFSGRGKQGA
jgi:hypothetical protein